MSGKRKEKKNKQIFDPLRQRYIVLTPEEMVRQQFVHFLIQERHYPHALLGNEVSIKLNGLSKRCDTVLLGKDGLPQMIIEYKRPSVALTQRVFDQISRYNIVLRVKYLIICNGKHSVCCRVNLEQQTYEFLSDIPYYEDL
ncbi:MAG: type I restriction enzyme HsdR N-terminal domain-containing protein [Bacteroidaceae bacterium]|nr:type I restriction enzyme HsdR N-terminal domain-containing protein [Bacteroidaceae bacterium]